DLEVSGEADIAALARWADVEPSPSGAFAFEGTVTGPLASPAASMRLRDGSLALDALAISDITAVIDADAMRIGVVSLDARLLGGAFAAAGELPLGDGDAVLTGRWSDIDVGAIARALAPQAGVVPAARTTGNVS